jgi:UDP-N-acetylmuramoyl-tripeptide--D-alanyl-D-alanine ligase
MNLQEVQTATGGSLSGGDAEFRAVSIDTRTLNEGDLFIAISGPNFDGNDFVTTATKQNACGAITSHEVNEGLPVLTVADTRKALGVIGALNRTRTTACVIALTGSQGKTTVKEMTADILSECGNVMLTQGNLNNELGVPLSLARIEAEHEFAVIELGANGPGEIAYTAGLTRPRIGHITNIAETHLEGFGDLDGVARAKAEIWLSIEAGGIAVVNLDDEYADQFIDQIRQLGSGRKVVTVSGTGNKAADYQATEISLDSVNGSNFKLSSPVGEVVITLQVAGSHNVSNALAAGAMAMSAGASLDHVRAGLEKFLPVKGRMCVMPGLEGCTVVDDSYNASPASFRAAIDVLSSTRATSDSPAHLPFHGRTVVVMGDMGELGNAAETAHREVGEYAREQSINHFIAVGDLSRLAVEAFGEGGIFLQERSRFVDVIRPLLTKSTTVLVKGSRSQRMEQLVQQIKADME